MKRQRGTGHGRGGAVAYGRAAGALATALCAGLALPGGAWAAAAGDGGYAFDSGARPVKGAVSNLDAERLQPGTTYRDSIKKDGKLYYRVDLDDKQNAYVSVVAVPRKGARAAGYGDGIKVSMQDGSNSQCGYQNVSFTGDFTRPLAAYAHRTIEPESTSCTQAGAYYVLVERDSKDGSDGGDWDLEIRYLTEPALTKAPGPTALPSDWASGTPGPPGGGPQRRDGGAGFHDATSLTQGEWRTDLRPGQTAYYRVPVDWGQQLFAGAELGSSPAGDAFVSNALVLSLENPARGHVDQESMTYSGDPATMALDPERPVAYENRFSSNDSTSAMRFAGWYYLSATLSPELAKGYGDKPLPVTLKVSVTGKAKAAPPYAGPAGEFSVTADDRDAAASGQSGPEIERSGTFKVVGVAGIGAGSVLLLGLGAWWLLARRRAD
ncbi:hypothetical protein ACF09L_14835 [Streptomyces sp. NPDC014779]|uniref:hypothetical protein n=1 Tax=unclassified Streptomyces TaxID=2593676 RepID=UPI0036F5A1BA